MIFEVFPFSLINSFVSSLCYCRYVREFGFTIPNRAILIDDIRVRGTGHSKTSVEHEIPKASTPPPVKKVLSCTCFENSFDEKKYLQLLSALSSL